MYITCCCTTPATSSPPLTPLPSPFSSHQDHRCTCAHAHATEAYSPVARSPFSSSPLSLSKSSLSARVSRLKGILSLLCVCLYFGGCCCCSNLLERKNKWRTKKKRKKTKERGTCGRRGGGSDSMGAEDAFANSTNSQFLLTNSSPTTSATSSGLSPTANVNGSGTPGIINTVASCGGDGSAAGKGTSGVKPVVRTQSLQSSEQEQLGCQSEGDHLEAEGGGSNSNSFGGGSGSNDIIVTEEDLIRQQHLKPVIRLKSVSFGEGGESDGTGERDIGKIDCERNPGGESTGTGGAGVDPADCGEQGARNNNSSVGSSNKSDYEGGSASVGGCASCNGVMDSSGGTLISNLSPVSANCSSGVLEKRSNCSINGGKMGASSVGLEGEWHQKYAFIVGLLRKPHVLLVKESLARERDKLCNKLSAYRLERNIVRESINKYIQNG